MDKSTKKVVKWEIIIGSGIFLLLLVLAIADVFSFMYLFVGIISLLILGSVIITIVIVLKKKSLSNSENEDEIYIKDTEAKLIAKQKLYDPDILEYEKELVYEKIGHFGTMGNEIPVYVRKMIGLFENNTIAVLVNMKNSQTSFKFYDDTKISQVEIDNDLEKEANLLVRSPAPSPKVKVTEESSPLTGITKITKEPIEKANDKIEPDGGLE